MVAEMSVVDLDELCEMLSEFCHATAMPTPRALILTSKSLTDRSWPPPSDATPTPTEHETTGSEYTEMSADHQLDMSFGDSDRVLIAKDDTVADNLGIAQLEGSFTPQDADHPLADGYAIVPYDKHIKWSDPERPSPFRQALPLLQQTSFEQSSLSVAEGETKPKKFSDEAMRVLEECENLFSESDTSEQGRVSDRPILSSCACVPDVSCPCSCLDDSPLLNVPLAVTAARDSRAEEAVWQHKSPQSSPRPATALQAVLARDGRTTGTQGLG